MKKLRLYVRTNSKQQAQIVTSNIDYYTAVQATV